MGKGNVTKSCGARRKYPLIRSKTRGNINIHVYASRKDQQALALMQASSEKIQALPTAVFESGRHLARSGRSLNSSHFRPADVGLRVFSGSPVPCFRTQTSNPHPECWRHSTDQSFTSNY